MSRTAQARPGWRRPSPAAAPTARLQAAAAGLGAGLHLTGPQAVLSTRAWAQDATWLHVQGQEPEPQGQELEPQGAQPEPPRQEHLPPPPQPVQGALSQPLPRRPWQVPQPLSGGSGQVGPHAGVRHELVQADIARMRSHGAALQAAEALLAATEDLLEGLPVRFGPRRARIRPGLDKSWPPSLHPAPLPAAGSKFMGLSWDAFRVAAVHAGPSRGL